MQASRSELPALERALLRQGVERRTAGRERCCGCSRTPLIGERIYFDDRGSIYCELCRALEPAVALEWETVRGPEFGHTLRLTAGGAA